MSLSARSSSVVVSVTGVEGGRGRYKCRASPLNMTNRDLLNRNGESVSQVLQCGGVGKREGRAVGERGMGRGSGLSHYLTYRDLLHGHSESVSQVLQRGRVGVLRGGKCVVQQGKLKCNVVGLNLLRIYVALAVF